MAFGYGVQERGAFGRRARDGKGAEVGARAIQSGDVVGGFVFDPNGDYVTARVTRLSRPEALIAGLVDHCIADAELDEFVQAFAAKLSNQPPHAIAAAKRCILAGRKGMEQGAAQELSETLALYGNEITLGLVDRQLEKGRQKKPVPQTG